MKIAVNTRLLLPGRLDGIGWFTFETLRRIVHQHPEHEFFFLFDRKPAPQFIFAPNITPIVLCPPARHPVLWYIYYEWSIPYILKKHKIDLFLSPDAYTSLRTKVPTLTVIHDINFEHAPDYLRPSHQRFMTYFSPRYARKSTRLATVSEYSKQDIIDTYGIESAKIDVVYNGSHSNYQPLSPDEQDVVRKKYTQGHPYFIFVGTISKRKNLTNTLAAFEKMKQEHPKDDSRLLVVGHRFWWGEEIKEIYDSMKHQQDVIFIGRAEADELARMLASSIGLVYCSFFEGFGIPIIEAFHAETPVITSNITSMPEVAGNAALMVDPHNADEISQAMLKLRTQPELRNQLIEKGRQRRTQFSWDRSADLLWESILNTK